MRELHLFFPDGSIDTEGIGPVVSDLRNRGVDSLEVLSCEGSRVKFRVRLEERLDCPELRANESVETVRELSPSPPEYLMEVSPYVPWPFVDDCSGTVICEHDIAIREEGLEITLIAPQSLIEEINSFLVESNVSCEVLSIGDYDGVSEGPIDSLSLQQREILLYAYQQGYYSIPRKRTLSDLADDLELDDSTISEILRRAENNTFSQMLENRT